MIHTLLNWLWQGAVVALAAGALLRVTRGVDARARELILLVALILVLLIPVGPVLSPGRDSDVTEAPVVISAVPAVSIPEAPRTAVLAVLGLWLAWAAVYAGRTISALASLFRIKGRCTPFPPERQRRLRYWTAVGGRGRRAAIVLSNDVRAAAVLGITTPVIAIAPPLLGSLADEDLDRVIVHEWAHVQRRDDLTNLILIGVRLVAGWHPGVWWLHRALAAEREAACDQRTARLTGSAEAVAACLVKLADIRARTAPRLAPGVLGTTRLAHRVGRLMKHGAPLSPARSAAAGVTAMAVLVVLTASVSTVSVVESRPDSQHVWISHRPLPLNPTLARVRLAPTLERQVNPELPKSAQAGRTRNVTPAPPDASRAAVSHAVVLDNLDPELGATPIASMAPAAEELVQPPATAVTVLSTVPGAAQSHPSSWPVASDSNPPPRTPWKAAADAGVAIGRGSEKAAVSTAGFFTRFGSKIAKSF